MRADETSGHASGIAGAAAGCAAAAVLWLRDVIFLDKPDGLLEPTIELRRDLVRLMRRYRPTRVVCQSPERSWKPTRLTLIFRDGATLRSNSWKRSRISGSM